MGGEGAILENPPKNVHFISGPKVMHDYCFNLNKQSQRVLQLLVIEKYFMHSSVTGSPLEFSTTKPWANWMYQVYSDGGSQHPCILASFELSFAAEYPAMKNSKDFLGTANAELPAAPDKVEGQCGKWGQLMRISWEGGDYLLELKFSQVFTLHNIKST